MSVAIGNDGEHLVASRLLAHGFHVFTAERNNRAFDLAIFHEGKYSLLRVKTSQGVSAQWTAKKDNSIFLELQKTNDYCVIVLNFGLNGNETFYIVPTSKVNKALTENHDAWMATPKKDGKSFHKNTAQRVIRFAGREVALGSGFNIKWANYQNNWDQLKGVA